MATTRITSFPSSHSDQGQGLTEPGHHRKSNRSQNKNKKLKRPSVPQSRSGKEGGRKGAPGKRYHSCRARCDKWNICSTLRCSSWSYYFCPIQMQQCRGWKPEWMSWCQRIKMKLKQQLRSERSSHKFCCSPFPSSTSKGKAILFAVQTL